MANDDDQPKRMMTLEDIRSALLDLSIAQMSAGVVIEYLLEEVTRGKVIEQSKLDDLHVNKEDTYSYAVKAYDKLQKLRTR